MSRAAGLDEVVAGEDFAGGADRVEGIALARAASWAFVLDGDGVSEDHIRDFDTGCK
jgi:hypothetical protein